jgi:hypothetical protein
MLHGAKPVDAEMIFICLYHLLTLIGLAIYHFKGEHFGICLASGFLISFVVIFIFILILLGNGDGNLDFLDFLGLGKKEKQKNKKEI